MKKLYIIGIVVIAVLILALYFYLNNLTFKSCNELGDLETKEFDNIDFSCSVDSDCVFVSYLPCGVCVNKNYDMSNYNSIDIEMSKRCSSASPACAARTKTPTGCKCIFNNYTNKNICAYV
jgi:hypothetical protein